MLLPEEVLRHRHGARIAEHHEEPRVGVDAAHGQVLVGAVHVPDARIATDAVDMVLPVGAAVLRIHDLRPRHGVVPDVARLVGVAGRQIDALTNELDDELLGEVGPDLLVGRDEDVVGVRVPGLPERIDRGSVDEGRVELAVDAVVQETVLVERLHRIEGAQHAAAADGAFHPVEAVDLLVERPGGGKQVLPRMHQAHGRADHMRDVAETGLLRFAPWLVAGLVEDLHGADCLTGHHVKHRRGQGVAHREAGSGGNRLVLAGGALEPGAGDHGPFAQRLPHQRSVDINDDPALRDAGPGFQPELLVRGVEHEQAAPFRAEQRRERQEEQAKQVAIAGLIPLAAQFLAAMGGLPETKKRFRRHWADPPLSA